MTQKMIDHDEPDDWMDEIDDDLDDDFSDDPIFNDEDWEEKE